MQSVAYVCVCTMRVSCSGVLEVQGSGGGLRRCRDRVPLAPHVRKGGGVGRGALRGIHRWVGRCRASSASERRGWSDLSPMMSKVMLFSTFEREGAKCRAGMELLPGRRRRCVQVPRMPGAMIALRPTRVGTARAAGAMMMVSVVAMLDVSYTLCVADHDSVRGAGRETSSRRGWSRRRSKGRRWRSSHGRRSGSRRWPEG